MPSEAELKEITVFSQDIPFADNGINAPTIFVDDIRGAGAVSGIVRLNLIENRFDPVSNTLTAKVVAVLAVPLEMVQGWGPFFVKHFPRPENIDSPQSISAQQVDG